MIPLNEISTPALAYLGDCVLEMLVRETLVRRGLSKSGHLNSEALHYVRASAPEKDLERPSSTRLEARFPYCREPAYCILSA